MRADALQVALACDGECATALPVIQIVCSKQDDSQNDGRSSLLPILAQMQGLTEFYQMLRTLASIRNPAKFEHAVFNCHICAVLQL